MSGVKRLNSEALSLYREILRTTKHFNWRNEKGELWSDILRVSARTEFEQARYETDPAVVTRLLLVGRDCVSQAKLKAAAEAEKIRNAQKDKFRK